MFQMGLWTLLAALASSLATGSNAGFSDASAFIQTDHVQVRRVPDAGKTELASVAPVPDSYWSRGPSDAETLSAAEQELESDQEWPQFVGDLWDTVKESVKEVTGELGDISSVLDGSIKQVVYNKTMETAAVVFAQALDKALVVVDEAAKKLMNRTVQEKHEILMLANESARELSLFESKLNVTLQRSLGNWRKVRSVVSIAGKMIGRSFDAAGQKNLSREFTKGFNVGMENMDFYVEGLLNVSQDLGGFSSDLAKPLLVEHLATMDRRLWMASMRVVQFAQLFELSFQGAVDHALDALPVATDRVNDEFGKVMHSVSDIVFQVRGSSRELIETCHSVVNFVAKENGIALPPWDRAGSFRGSLAPLALLASALFSLLP